MLEHPDWRVEATSRGGDVDTTQVVIDVPLGEPVGDVDREYLYVSGFVVVGEGYIEDPDDADVSMVEVTDGHDSRGGLNSADEKFCIAYGIVCSRLRKAGFSVCNTMNDYF